MTRVLIVSPHRDDAAFSCGIAIRALARHTQVTIANFFTISRYAPLSNIQPELISDLRRQEDIAFAKLSGASLHDLNLIDAPERLAIGVTQISTLREFGEADFACINRIRGHIVQFGADLVIAPLALGDHIDHRIAQAAARRVGIAAMAFYEDLPYAARLPDDAPLKRADTLNMALTPLEISAGDGYQWKQNCVRCYPSQVGNETVLEISEYSKRHGCGERLWLAPGVCGWLRRLGV